MVTPINNSARWPGPAVPGDRATDAPAASTRGATRRPGNPIAPVSATSAAIRELKGAAAAAPASSRTATALRIMQAQQTSSSDSTTSANPVAASDAILPGTTSEELADLANWYDHGEVSARRQQFNAARLARMAPDATTGYAAWARQFEQKLPALQVKIADLPEGEREHFTAQAVMLTAALRNAANPADRERLSQLIDQFRSAVDAEHIRVMSDPLLHIESLFNAPYGYGYLDRQGQRDADRLGDYRERFHNAASADEREQIVSLAAAVRAELQNSIAVKIDQRRAELRRQTSAARADVEAALNSAASLTGERVTPAERLTGFGAKAFADARHARAFTDAYTRTPEKFAALRGWEDQLARADADAGRAEQHRLGNRILLPAFTKFTDVAGQPPLPNSAYDEALLGRYQYAQRRMVAAQARLNVQGDPGGPLRQQTLERYAPPEPSVLQEINEGACRFTLGVLTGSPQLADAAGPRSDMSAATRNLIDRTAGAINAALGFIDGEGPFAAAGKMTAEAFSSASKLLDKLRLRAPGTAAAAPKLGQLPLEAASSGLDPALAGAMRHISGARPLPRGYELIEPAIDTGASGFKGIGQNAGGQKFVSIDGANYAVKWDKGNNTWRVYDRNNPWRPAIAVRQNTVGNWETHSEVGLKGGMPNRGLSQQERDAIVDRIRSYPDERYVDIAARFDVSSSIVGRVAREAGITRPLMLRQPLTPAAATAVIADLQRGRAAREIARIRHLPYERTQAIAAQIELPRSTRVRSPHPPPSDVLPGPEAVVSDLRGNPNASLDEIAARNGVTQEFVAQAAAHSGVRRPAVVRSVGSDGQPVASTAFHRPAIQPAERESIASWIRDHPQDSQATIAHRFGRSELSIRDIAEAEGIRTPPLIDLTDEQVQSATAALRAQPDAPYETIATTSHLTPADVEELAEFLMLERAHTPMPQESAAPLASTDLPANTVSGAENGAGPLSALNDYEKTFVNAHADWAPEFLADLLDVNVEQMNAYMRTPEFLQRPRSPVF